MVKINKLNISGKSVWPIIEGGKGINISNGTTAGHFAHAGAVGTISGTNPDFYDFNGNVVRYSYDKNSTRREKFEQLIKYSIMGGISQAKIAHDISGGNGALHMNFLWEAGGTQRILEGVLDKVKGLIHGITAGAGMPYALSKIAAKYNVYYYPIISSARAFKILWKRSYKEVANLLGGVVYEDPWLAGGHNGLSNAEDPKKIQDPYNRIVEIRQSLTEYGLDHVPIIIAGGVWNLSDWEKYIGNSEVGLVAFQFGTRPLVTQESPIPEKWKSLFLNLKPGDVMLHKFSPTGFYSSAINNDFLKELQLREEYQMEARRKEEVDFNHSVPSGNGVTFFYVKKEDYNRALEYINNGYNTLLRTPDKTVIFVTKERALDIKQKQIDCMGCLSACRFSGWSDHNDQYATGILPDPRSFCIQDTLQDLGHGGGIDNNLLFAGHHAYRFSQDEFYKNKNVPTIAQLVDRILQGK